MKKGLYALSFGTFGLGIAEFIMMSILPDVAAGFDISLSEAGHLISAYALGVCVGAPLVVVVARSWPLRTILLALILSIRLCVVGRKWKDSYGISLDGV
ncbi:MFS transporter, partial [Parabacteroides merdae]